MSHLTELSEKSDQKFTCNVGCARIVDVSVALTADRESLHQAIAVCVGHNVGQSRNGVVTTALEDNPTWMSHPCPCPIFILLATC